MSVVLPIVSLAACNQSYPGAIVHSNMFCTLYEGTPGKDSCTGDSGGPAWACDGDGHGVLLGTVSYGDLVCGKPGSPGVLMSVAQNLAWITAQTGYTRPADAQAPDDTFCVGSATPTPTTPTTPTSSTPSTSFAPSSFAPTALQPGSSSEGLSSGAIAGIVIGAVLGAALLALLLFKVFAGRAKGGGSPSGGAPPGAASASAPPADKAAAGASAPASADAPAPPAQMQRV
jgi:hypothetical protein